MQFAPLLVFFNNMPPMQAVQVSIRGILKNIGPILVYYVTLALLAALATIPMFLGWFILMPLFFTSLYASYCGIFPREEKPSSPPPQSAFDGGSQSGF